MTPNYELPSFTKTNKSEDYRQHRSVLKEMGEVLSGMKPTHESDHYVFFYRTPSYETASFYPRITKLMDVDLVYDGNVFSCNDKAVIALSNSESLEFLTSLLHVVSTHRRAFALAANERMQMNDRTYPTPPGAEGHLLKEYDYLIDQIKHEYHHRRRESANETGSL